MSNRAAGRTCRMENVIWTDFRVAQSFTAPRGVLESYAELFRPENKVVVLGVQRLKQRSEGH